MERLSRRETLSILSAIGVELPPETRLSDEALEKRLKQAINAAQCLAQHIPNSPLNPATLAAWPSTSPGDDRSVHDAVKRGDMAEALANLEARMQGRDNAVALYQNAVLDLRQTLMALASMLDEGRRWCDAGPAVPD